MSARPAPHAQAVSAPAMTACECTGRSFAEVEARMRRDGLSAREAEGLTGCGSLCTACLPDLRSYLGRHEQPGPSVPKE
jgi:bacterioferritin-associated ferredoxin